MCATFPRKAPHPINSLRGDQKGTPSPPWKRILEYFNARGNVLLAGDFNARTFTLPDFHEDGALSSHIPSSAQLEHNYALRIPPRCSSDTGKSDPFGKALTDMTQAHSMVICNGRLRGGEKGAYTHRSHRTGVTGEGKHSLIDYFTADPDLYLQVLRA
jgi:hypothetical protein